MKYAIVYSSETGNTRILAEKIREMLPDCVYFGEPEGEIPEADRFYVGFWTNQGRCDARTEEFLSTLYAKEVFLFGTAGFGESSDYFTAILEGTQAMLSPDIRVIGSFMCQGKMPMSVRERYVQMQTMPGKREAMERMIRNFDQALSHPDGEDLDKLGAIIQKTAEKQ